MPFYKCPVCPRIFEESEWGMLKGHMGQQHKQTDLAQSTKDNYKDLLKAYEISEEEYNSLKHPSLAPLDNQPTKEPTNQPTNQPTKEPTNQPTKEPTEDFSQYSGEPIDRLRQVLLVNGGNAGIVQIVTKIMNLSPWLWGNPYELEGILAAHFGEPKRKWVQQCVAQYIRGVELPNDTKGMSPYNYGQPNSYGQPTYGFPYPNQPPPGQFGPSMVSPEVAEMRAEIAHLREERQKEHEQQLLNRIADLEKKVEAGGQPNPLMEKIKDLEAKLSGAGQSAMMTIYDDKGNPMVVPYDRSFMAALNRKQEVETEAIRTEQMIKMMTLSGGNTDKYSPILEALKKDMEAANKRVEDLTKQLHDQQITELRAEIKAAQDMAANSGGDGKGILEVAEQAGADIKEGAMAVAKEVKDSFESGMKTIKEIVTNRPATVVNTTPRSPQEISAIMEAENDFLKSLGE